MSQINNEIWIPVYRNYEVSNLGRVKCTRIGFAGIMKPFLNNRGYHCLGFRIGGRRIKMTVHKLVGLIFVKNTDPLKVTVNHNKGNKDINMASELSWMTYSENTRHAVKSGLIKSGSSSHSAKLDSGQVDTIRSLKGEISKIDLAKYFDVSRRTISDIMAGRTHKIVLS